jgi:exosortase
MTSVSTRARVIFWPALLCALSGAAIFQFLGNSTRGYVHSSSLFYWWGYQWINPLSETQHGLLIFAISVWLLLRNVNSRPGVPGDAASVLPCAICAMVCGLLFHVIGYVAEQARMSIAGLLLFTWGVAAFAGGPRWAKAAAFPLAFMVFAVPLSALDSAGFWLRMWVVGASATITHGFGIGVLVNGTQLLSPDGHYDYDVAAACSGVRSLIALSALSLLIGYIRFRPLWLRTAMLALCFPLIYIGNVARIVAIIVAAHLGGQAWGDRVHEIMGFGIFAIVLGGVFGIAEIVAKRRPDWVVPPSDRRPREGVAQFAAEDAGKLWPTACAMFGLVAIAALVLVHVSHLPSRGRAGITLAADGVAPIDLPTFIGTDWIGRRTEVSEVEKELLPPDTGFSRKTYVSLADPGQQAFVSIVLSGRDRTSIHRPELCLVGQGWTILGSFNHRFSYPGRGIEFPATVLRVQKEVMTPNGRQKVPQLVAYYFVAGDFIVATHWERIVRDAWNRVLHGRADRWAYVLIQTGSSDGEALALARIQTVLDGTLPVFQKRTGLPEQQPAFATATQN